MISKSDLTTDVKYFGAKINDSFVLIGYVDVKHNDVLVFHQALTQRSVDDPEIKGKSTEEIQALAQGEAQTILNSDIANNCINDYITLVNLGLYNA